MDELHYYNGLLGSHVAFIMRRLRRTCAALGNRRVKFISCSATVGNPEQHFRTIFGVDDVQLVDFDGSPSGERHPYQQTLRMYLSNRLACRTQRIPLLEHPLQRPQ